VQRYVAELLSAAPSAVATAKHLIAQVAGRAPEDVAEFTATTIAAQRASAEGQDGLRSFLEKRSPGWLPR
jgi:methylglutaconyl-CoA hydratase